MFWVSPLSTNEGYPKSKGSKWGRFGELIKLVFLSHLVSYTKMRNNGLSSLQLIGEKLGEEKKSKWLVRLLLGYTVLVFLITHLLPAAYWIADIEWIFLVMDTNLISGLIADWRSWKEANPGASFRSSDCSKGEIKTNEDFILFSLRGKWRIYRLSRGWCSKRRTVAYLWG